MGKRRFRLDYEWKWEALLEIDEEKAASTLKEVVEFWYGWESVLNKFKGDYAQAFCWYIGPLLLEKSGDSGLDWIREESFKNEEGYCMTLNGENGIELISIDDWTVDHDDFEINEVRREEVGI
ncbi:DUF2528 family protein [Rudanella paleaurantiibacter]|uniref:DUF2528 family protein n=1 Tax=Rudanella paleaurantiibacter TaxID=2614655 RepID=A0A7J5TW41_9BACT|nr:DUF2528 family protein [Rudanella paleaurantiibacter]KAB7728153.1 DUF2528 family protein [Rudanella paleaurantiibacter]